MPKSKSGASEQRIATYVRDARKAKGWSQERLAARSGTTRQTIYALEKNGSGTISLLLAVLSALDVAEFPVRGGLEPKTIGPSPIADFEEVRRYVAGASRQLEMLETFCRERTGDKRKERPVRKSAGGSLSKEHAGDQFLRTFGGLGATEQFEFLRDLFTHVRAGSSIDDTIGSKAARPAGEREAARRRR